MLSPRHQQKLRHHHQVLDFDRSGRVTKDDFEKIAANFARLRGQAVGSPMHRKLLDKFQFVWTRFWEPMGAGKGGRIEADDFVAAIGAAVDAGVRADDELLPLLFEVIDANGNGNISAEEHRQFFEGFGIDAALSPAVFEKLDRNGDGRVSREEFLEAGAKFFFFDEADAPGNHFWGPVH
jgi:juvenile hormone diol kinase